VPLSGWRQHAYLITKARRMKRAIDKVARSKDKESAAGRLQDSYRPLIDYAQRIVERALDSYVQVKALKYAGAAAGRPTQRSAALRASVLSGGHRYMNRSGGPPGA